MDPWNTWYFAGECLLVDCADIQSLKETGFLLVIHTASRSSPNKMTAVSPSPGDLPDPGIEPSTPALQADALTSEPPGKPIYIHIYIYIYTYIYMGTGQGNPHPGDHP